MDRDNNSSVVICLTEAGDPLEAVPEAEECLEIEAAEVEEVVAVAEEP